METREIARDRNEVRPPPGERPAAGEPDRPDRAGAQGARAAAPGRGAALDPCGPEAGAIEYDSWRLT